MKKISIAILTLLVVLSACKKVPEVNLKYVDVERDLITVGTTTATVQCDYEYIATLKKACLYYGEGENEADMNTAEMRVVQNTLYVDLAGLKENSTYSYYYEFHNGFNSMRTAVKTFKTETSPVSVTLPTVITAEVTEITNNSAKGGGEVTNDGGAEVTERGICWSTNENPNLNDNHIAAGSGLGDFAALMDNLQANTTYHVRAYATNETGVAYGLEKEFTTIDSGGCDCGYVDLGLPSGTLWATCNVGANSPEEFGDYFAWGETQPKTTYNLYSYIHFSNNGNFLITKYCNNSEYGYNGFVDNLTILLPEDDAASANWGDDWRMPTKDEWQELLQNTTNIWTAQDGVNGRRFTGTNGNSIFIPASGFRLENDLVVDNYNGYCWTSSLSLDCPTNAWYLCFGSFAAFVDPYNGRQYGYPVRPIRAVNTPSPSIDVPEGAINGLFTINENGDQVYFSQGNLQYQASTNIWRFAENQWDFVGGIDLWTNEECGNVYENDVKCDNSLKSSTYSGWIDLFGWGTSGYDHGAVAFQPWSTSTTHYHYNAYGNPNFNLYDQTGQADWGYNAISNGGNAENLGWRTLTVNECNYLFSRNTSSGICYARGLVNDVCGVILLPDSWSTTFYALNDTNGGNYNSNVISTDEWENIFEANGAVFLPAGGWFAQDGFIITNNFVDLGFAGNYWYSSFYSDPSAYSLYFNTEYLNPLRDYSRYVGQSVRLVLDANL